MKEKLDESNLTCCNLRSSQLRAIKLCLFDADARGREWTTRITAVIHPSTPARKAEIIWF